jgi:protein-S-isoprenylcysteine O-methyltransferase Ste14
MFSGKNFYLRMKIRKQIRGNNKEAVSSMFFIIFFILLAVLLSRFETPAGTVQVISTGAAAITALVLICMNLVIVAVSLVNMKDSWRMGVLENQKTPLIVDGIYRYSRNPFFLSFLIMFAAYTILLQNIILLGLSLVGFFLIHWMIIKEEKYLESVHGEDYLQYKTKVPRYLIV